MIKRIGQVLVGLSIRQRIVLGIDVIIPIILQSLQHWIQIRDSIIIPIYVVWGLFAVLSIAAMMKDDKTKAEENMDRKLRSLSNEVRLLKEENERKIIGLQDHVKDLREMNKTVRAAFEGLGVSLPPEVVSLRVSVSGGTPRLSDNLTVVNPRKLARFHSWVKRQITRFWRWLYG